MHPRPSFGPAEIMPIPAALFWYRAADTERLEGKMAPMSCTFKRADQFVSACPFGALGVNVEGAGLAFYDFWPDDDLLHPVEAGQLKHRVEQNALHD